MNYINADMGNMRRDALRRSRELHRESEKESMSENACRNSQGVRTDGVNGFLSKFFSEGKPDSDKIIIAALIIILAGEGADLKLLLALGYILL
ncbi:MAG: hypothetical protein NC320_12880 [Clostridium sp.]|nr:hypothetical protein [Clostridium sp.]MCM1548288.1 hypothetical protein [Ruminococcus sp.]